MERLPKIVDRLRQGDVPFALIGAAAMSVHGFARQTFDIDFLTTKRSILHPDFCAGFPSADVRIGDFDDPLAGVVRFEDPNLDIVVGKFRWQSEMVDRAVNASVGGTILPVVTLPDLIALKLDAGGFRDLNDVRMMCATENPERDQAVEKTLGQMPGNLREVWSQVRGR